MNKRIIITALILSTVTIVATLSCITHRNTWVTYIPTTLEDLHALPKDALRFENGGFLIQRKNVTTQLSDAR